MDNLSEENIVSTPDEADIKPKKAYSNGFFSTLTFQIILCLIIVIGMVLLNTFCKSEYASVELSLKEEISTDKSTATAKKLAGVFSDFLSADNKAEDSEDTVRQSESDETLSKEENAYSADSAQGGQPNVIPDGEVPAKATLTSVTANEGFILPLDTINVTSPFGFRLHPITNQTEFHYGVDLASAQNSNIYAVASGVVSDTGYSDGYGNYVEITHKTNIKTFYAHCESVAVTKGSSVSQGEVIAYVGSTGVSTGYHLHFGASLNGVYFNPKHIINI